MNASPSPRLEHEVWSRYCATIYVHLQKGSSEVLVEITHYPPDVNGCRTLVTDKLPAVPRETGQIGRAHV